MKRLPVFTGLVLILFGGQAVAQCDTGRLTGPQIGSFFSGRTICATATGQGGSNAGDRWQEFHQAGGALIEFAKGPNDPVDPSHPVGTWTATSGSDARITYNYSGGSSYTWLVYNANGTLSFCDAPGGSTVATGRLFNGQIACTF